MPYTTSEITRLTEAVERHDGLVRAALADGHIDDTEAATIGASSRGLVLLICWFATLLRVALWVLHAGHPPRDFLREHPGWARGDMTTPPTA